MNDLKILLVLDDMSKSVINTDITSLNSYGVFIVSSFSEITDKHLEEFANIVILEGLVQKSVGLSDIRLFSKLFKRVFTFLGSDKTIFPLLESYCNCYYCDISKLDYEMVQAAIFNSSTNPKDLSLNKLDFDSIAQSIVKGRDFSKSEVLDLAEHNLAIGQKYKALYDMYSVAVSELEKLRLVNEKLQTENQLLTAGYTEIVEQSHQLNQSLKQYEIILTRDIYNKLDLASYPNKPLIIYFKVFEPIIHLNSLLETLFDTFRLQERKSVKVLKLYDSSNCNSFLSTPSYYTKITNQYQMKDVLIADYICKTGDYTNLLDILLQNRTNLDILIIVDNKYYNDIVLSGSMLQLNICRKPKDLDIFKLNKSNTIINDLDDSLADWLRWGHYDMAGLTDEERFLYLSSRPLIGEILNMSRLFEEMI